MSGEDLVWTDGYRAAAMIRSGEMSSLELIDATLAHLERLEPSINAFVTVTADQAREAARAADARVAAADDPESLPPLLGVPVSIKDLTETAGVRTTFGSTEFSSHVPAADSTTAARVRATGAVLIGKTTTPEFGMLGTTESALTGITNNPWNLEFAAGGSSGGAAAAVAAGDGVIAWGSDGGGSIRVPASMCGVVGFKPSLGRIPNGHPWDASSSEGPITRSVADAALLFRETSGPDRRDPLSLPNEGIDYFQRVRHLRDLRGTRVAFAPRPAGGLVAREVDEIVTRAVGRFADAGVIVEVVDLPLPDPVEYFLAFWGPAFGRADQIAALPHAAMRYLASKSGGPAEYFEAATTTRVRLYEVYQRVFDNVDFIVTPTLPVTPFRHPGDLGGNSDVDGVPVAMPQIDFHRFTESPSHAGLPALTVPCGFSVEGLPVGLQIVGNHLDDAGVLELGALFEQLAPWRDQRPPIAEG